MTIWILFLIIIIQSISGSEQPLISSPEYHKQNSSHKSSNDRTLQKWELETFYVINERRKFVFNYNAASIGIQKMKQCTHIMDQQKRRLVIDAVWKDDIKLFKEFVAADEHLAFMCDSVSESLLAIAASNNNNKILAWYKEKKADLTDKKVLLRMLYAYNEVGIKSLIKWGLLTNDERRFMANRLQFIHEQFDVVNPKFKNVFDLLHELDYINWVWMYTWSKSVKKPPMLVDFREHALISSPSSTSSSEE